MPRSDDDNLLGIGKLPGPLLAQLLAGIASDQNDVIVGPGVGRDAAAIRVGDAILVLKTDPITFATAGAAHYLVNINANDLACLGATPKWMLVTAMFPSGTSKQDVEQTFAELEAVSRRRSIALIGGHTEITPSVNQPVLVGMMVGIASNQRFLSPGGARDGDVLVLSQPIAIEGTALLASELASVLSERLGPDLVARASHLLESPGLSVDSAADIALRTIDVHAMHDPTEGGIAMGAREIAVASGLAAELHAHRIPVFPETQAIAETLDLNPLGMLASGSLLLACAKPEAYRVMEAWRAIGAQPAIIGRLHEATEGHRLVDGLETREIPTFDFDEVSRALRAFAGV